MAAASVEAKAIFKEKCTLAVGTAQSAVKKLPNCPLSQIRLDWTSCFAGIVTEKDNSLSEDDYR
jgi:hypothetical protein